MKSELAVADSRSAALRDGIKSYLGKPCAVCGSKIKQTSNGSCIACSRARTKAWRLEHVAETRAASLDWYYRNHERAQKTMDEWRSNNSEHIAKTAAERWGKNRDRYTVVAKQWRSENQDKRRCIQENRRARQLEASGWFSAMDAEIIMKLQDDRCAYCNETENLQLDHIIPLSRGGSNWPWNIQWLCSHHNSSKNSKTDNEYRAIIGLPTLYCHRSVLFWLGAFLA